MPGALGPGVESQQDYHQYKDPVPLHSNDSGADFGAENERPASNYAAPTLGEKNPSHAGIRDSSLDFGGSPQEQEPAYGGPTSGGTGAPSTTSSDTRMAPVADTGADFGRPVDNGSDFGSGNGGRMGLY